MVALVYDTMPQSVITENGLERGYQRSTEPRRASFVPPPPKLQPHRQRHVTFQVDELGHDLVDVLEFELPPVEIWSDLYLSHEPSVGFFEEACQIIANMFSS